MASGLGTARKGWWTDERHQIFMMFLVSLVESFQSSQPNLRGRGLGLRCLKSFQKHPQSSELQY